MYKPNDEFFNIVIDLILKKKIENNVNLKVKLLKSYIRYLAYQTIPSLNSLLEVIDESIDYTEHDADKKDLTTLTAVVKDFHQLENGFYFLFNETTTLQPSLVKLYTNPDTEQRGVGFGIWDGCGFISLNDLATGTILIKVEVEENQKSLYQKSI